MHIAYRPIKLRKSIPLTPIRMSNVTAIANYDVQIAFVYFKLRLLHQYWHRTGRLNINQMADGLWTRQLRTIDNNKAVPSWVRGYRLYSFIQLFWVGCGTDYTASYSCSELDVIQTIQLHTAVLSCMWYRLYSFIQLFWVGCDTDYTASYSCSELDVLRTIQLHTAVLSCMWYRLYSFIQQFWVGCGTDYTASYSCSELDVV